MKMFRSMPTIWALALLFIPLAVLSAEGKDSRVFSFDKFDSLSVSSGIQVNVVQGTTYGIVARGNPDELDRLNVDTFGSTLRLGFKPFTFTFGDKGPVVFEISMPKLVNLTLSGGSRAKTLFNDQESVTVILDASGGSLVEGVLTAKNLTFNLSGGSRGTIEGFSDSITGHVSGGSQFMCRDFASGSAVIEASGGSQVQIAVQDKLVAQASGGSRIAYRGKPALTVDTSGGSSVEVLR